MKLKLFNRDASSNQGSPGATGTASLPATAPAAHANRGSLPASDPAATFERSRKSSPTAASRRLPSPRALAYALQDPDERSNIGNCCIGARSANGTTKINVCCLGIRDEPDRAVVSCCWIPCCCIRD